MSQVAYYCCIINLHDLDVTLTVQNLL